MLAKNPPKTHEAIGTVIQAFNLFVGLSPVEIFTASTWVTVPNFVNVRRYKLTFGSSKNRGHWGSVRYGRDQLLIYSLDVSLCEIWSMSVKQYGSM